MEHMTDHFAIPDHLKREGGLDRLRARLWDRPTLGRRMIYPETTPEKPGSRFVPDEGSAKTLRTFGWTNDDLKAITSRRELDTALDSIENPANWKTKD